MDASIAQPVQSHAPQGPPATPRLHFIDGLRGLAMLMVVAFHCAAYSGGWHAPGDLLGFVSYGHIGVNLFLVLSGFCLYWPFVNGAGRREPTLWQFARKRCRRILPPYYAALALFWPFLLWDVLTHHHFHQDATSAAHVVKSLLWHLTMLQNLRPAYVLSINGPFWSLALEASLYLLLPILVEAFRRFGPVRPLAVLLAVNLGYRLALVPLCPPPLLTGEEQFVLFYSLFGRCFEFGAGMLAAYLLATQHRPALRFSGAACLISALAGAFLVRRFGLFGAFTDITWGLCFACLVLAASRPGNTVNRAFSKPLIVNLGVISYSVYLIHQPLVKALDGVAVRHHLPTALFGVVVIIPLMLGLGYLFHLLFEKPFMSAPRPRPTLPPAPVPVPTGRRREAV